MLRCHSPYVLRLGVFMQMLGKLYRKYIDDMKPTKKAARLKEKKALKDYKKFQEDLRDWRENIF
jgi:hypothetical protein